VPEELLEDWFRAFVSELEKARKGLVIYAICVLVLSAASLAVAQQILQILVGLLHRKLVAFNPSEGFVAVYSIAIYCGLGLSLPIGAALLWRGVVARLRPEWRGWGFAVIGAATAFFAAGVLFAYFVLLPAGIRFLVGFETKDLHALLSARRFVSFCGTMLLVMGFAFETPLISFFLARIGWLTPGFFRHRWRHAVLGCVVLAAIVTPTPDAYNLTLMSVPLLILFFASFVIVWAVDRAGRRRGKE